MEEKKAKCPICNSKKNTINGNLFRCLNCGYVNDNFKNFIKKRAKNPKIVVKPLNLKSPILNDIYIKIIKTFIGRRNKYMKEFTEGNKPTFDAFCMEFEDILKRMFEQEDR